MAEFTYYIMQGENFNQQISNNFNFNSIRSIDRNASNFNNLQSVQNQNHLMQKRDIMDFQNQYIFQLSANYLLRANILLNHIRIQSNQTLNSNAREIKNDEKYREIPFCDSQSSTSQSSNSQSLSSEIKEEEKSNITSKVRSSKKISKKQTTTPKDKPLSTRLKNMIKNYGKKCAHFAISKLGDNIVKQKLNQNEISRFRHYIKGKIQGITNMHNFKEILLIKEDDTPEIAKFKKTFQYTSEIFIENYSMNWIMNSPKIRDVKGHIFARFKILRRIRDPKYFTYMH